MSATFPWGTTRATIRPVAETGGFPHALRDAILDRGWKVNEFARAYEPEGATRDQVRNRAGAVRRWLRGANTPTRLSVRRCETVLGLEEGTLERTVRRDIHPSLQEQVADLYEMVRELQAKLDRPDGATGRPR